MEEKLTEEQIKAKSLLDKIKEWFNPSAKEIKVIQVHAGTQKFYCSNPKKINYWKTLAERQALFAFDRKSDCTVKITKVIYK